MVFLGNVKFGGIRFTKGDLVPEMPPDTLSTLLAAGLVAEDPDVVASAEGTREPEAASGGPPALSPDTPPGGLGDVPSEGASVILDGQPEMSALAQADEGVASSSPDPPEAQQGAPPEPESPPPEEPGAPTLQADESAPGTPPDIQEPEAAPEPEKKRRKRRRKK